jgi:hypothetical protein
VFERFAWRSRRVVCDTRGTPFDRNDVSRMFTRVLRYAKLPLHFQRQLGHASTKLTVDTYGKWLPMGNKRAGVASTTWLATEVVAKR